MENLKDILPIGSVVLLKGGVKKLMVIGIFTEVQREEKIIDSYDYIGVVYPEGFLGLDSMMLFNQSDINDIVFRGYANPEHHEFIEYVEEIKSQQ